VQLQRDLPSLDYGMAGESTRQASDDPPSFDFPRDMRVAPGIERGELASKEETDHATTE
jgi:hypothetical protein